MVAHSLFLSFFIGVVIPAILLPFFPEVLNKKDLDDGFENITIIYLSLVFILFSFMLYFNRKHEIIFVEKCKASTATNTKLAMFFILTLYLSRIFYLFFISDSPYSLLAQTANMQVDGLSNKIINYFYIVSNFKLYPLLQGMIILSLPRKYLPIFFLGELSYAVSIYSKYIIFINIIAMTLLYFDYKDLWYKKKGIFFIILFSLFSIILLFVLRELFGQLRLNEFKLDLVGYRSIIVDGISRVQSLLSVFYAEKVLDDWLYGKTLCHIVGYQVPDSLISLPLSCRNIDEPIIIYYYGLSSISIIEKDMLSLWGEPFANFGVFGILLFVLVFSLVKLCMKTLGENQYGLLFSWVVFINCLMAHNAWSTVIGNIYISFVFIWLIQLFAHRHDSANM